MEQTKTRKIIGLSVDTNNRIVPMEVGKRNIVPLSVSTEIIGMPKKVPINKIKEVFDDMMPKIEGKLDQLEEILLRGGSAQAGKE